MLHFTFEVKTASLNLCTTKMKKFYEKSKITTIQFAEGQVGHMIKRLGNSEEYCPPMNSYPRFLTFFRVYLILFLHLKG